MIDCSFYKKLNGPSGEISLDVSLHYSKPGFITLYGKSGVGKTSTFNILAGLLHTDSGKIIMNDQTWLDTDKQICLPPQKRKVGFVFQDYALFPHMTVKENLSYALIKGEDQKIIDELIELVALGDLQYKKPETLSGGQKQRVALARSLVQKPQLLLLDEPFSALDGEMKALLQNYILEVHYEYKLTTLMITHDVPSILKMSDHVVVLDNGKVINQGKPSKILTHQEISGKFQFTGEIISIDYQDLIYIVSIIIGNDLVKVVADKEEVANLIIGEKVLVASKAFNPIIKKLK